MTFQRLQEHGTRGDGAHYDQDRSINGFTLLVVFFSTISGLLFGYDLCVVTVALRLVKEHFSLSTTSEEAFVSLVFVGATFGSLAGSPIADVFGRKPVIAVCSAVFALSAVVMMLAQHFGVLLVGRFLVGFAIGGSSTCVSVYISELSKPALRGVLVSLNELALCVGCLVAIVTGVALEDARDGWRWMLGLAAAPAFIQLAGVLLVLPESPRWLLSHGHGEAAAGVMRRIYAPHTRKGEAAIQLMHEDESRADPTQQATLGDQLGMVWQNMPMRKAVMLSVGVAMAQNLTASNAILYFSSEIFAEAGVTGLGVSIGVGLAKLLGVSLALALIPRVGRKQLLLAGTSVQATAFAVLCFAFALFHDQHSVLGVIGVTAVLVFILAWNCSWAPLMFVVCSELLPAKARGTGMGLAMTGFWITSLLTNQLLLSLIDAVGPAWAFCLLCMTTLCALAFVSRCVPETKDKTLDEIQDMFKQAETLERDISVEMSITPGGATTPDLSTLSGGTA